MQSFRATDWDSYYKKPAKSASVTRKISERKIIAHLKALYNRDDAPHICEIGGANSCFYEAIIEAFPNCSYTVLDNNEYGLELFRKKSAAHSRTAAMNIDATLDFELDEKADLVFSVGLIEHFTPDVTAKVIAAHYRCLKDDGHVLITFPTPTWLYRLTRGMIERLGKWEFHDERPLVMTEVLQEMKKHGEVLSTEINWPIILTQGIITSNKKPIGA